MNLDLPPRTVENSILLPENARHFPGNWHQTKEKSTPRMGLTANGYSTKFPTFSDSLCVWMYGLIWESTTLDPTKKHQAQCKS